MAQVNSMWEKFLNEFLIKTLQQDNINAETISEIKAALLPGDVELYRQASSLPRHGNILRILQATISLENLILKFSFYESIFHEVNTYFSNVSSHRQHSELRSLLKKTNDVTYLTHLFAINIFSGLSTTQSVITAKVEEHIITKIMSHVVEQISTPLHTHLGIICDYHEIKYITIKKYTFVLLHIISEKNPQLLSIKTQKRETMIDLRDFLKETPSYEPYENNITVVELSINFYPNEEKRYFISETPPSTLKKNQFVYSYHETRLSAHQIIIQNYNREKTTITDSFIDAVVKLQTTPYYLDKNLATKIESLVVNELNELWDEFYTLLEIKTQDIRDVKELLTKFSRQAHTAKYIRNALQNIFVRELKDTNHDTQILNIIKKTTQQKNLIKGIFNKSKEEDKILQQGILIQKIFSHLLLLTNYLTYIKYLDKNNIVKLYFTVYSDFRGRLYYRSEATPQSIWCFRFIYHYNKTLVESLTHYPLYNFQIDFIKKHNKYSKNPAIVELIQAVGTIFKSSCVDTQTGSLKQEDLLNLGEKIVDLFHTNPQDVQFTSLQKKDLAELIYYCHAIKEEINGVTNGYYIWKDTTASMAQHGGKILGYNDPTLKYLNLDNEFIAYDTYQVVINALKKEFQENSLFTREILQKLNRKTLKQLIMTCEYQVSEYTASKRFKALILDLQKNDSTYACLDNALIFKAIFKKLKDGFIAELFYKTTQIAWFKKHGVDNDLILSDLTLPTKYYTIANHRLYYEIGDEFTRKRLSISTIRPLWEVGEKTQKTIDKGKTQQAAYVNQVHAYDALFLRDILRASIKARVDIAAIHDGFGVAYYNTKWLIGAANAAFSAKKLHTYSFTIII